MGAALPGTAAAARGGHCQLMGALMPPSRPLRQGCASRAGAGRVAAPEETRDELEHRVAELEAENDWLWQRSCQPRHAALRALAPSELDSVLEGVGSGPRRPLGRRGEQPEVVRGEAGRQLPGHGAVAVKLRAGRRGGGGAEDQRRFLREIYALHQCPEDDHLVPLLAICVPRLACVFPWPHRGSLLGALLSSCAPSPAEGFGVLRDVALGLSTLHAHGLVHRNVRSAHVLLFQVATEQVAKLGGCGWVDVAETAGRAGLPQEVVGVPPYIDPMYLSSGKCWPASDVFSLGVVALEVLLARPAAQPAARGVPGGGESADQDQGVDCTRRPREEPIWAPFDGLRFDGPQAAGEAAAALVLRGRPRPDWNEQALEGAAQMVTSMLCVGPLHEVVPAASPPPGRPTAWEAAGCFEVAGVMQEDPERGERTCVVCLAERVDTQLRPCRHSCLCEGCARQMTANHRGCPICRHPVTTYQLGDFNATFVGATLRSRA
mmetsp:Transcript_81415/g.220576  ORF Transcript_81415/g.220576 Transcript_81415/m.220576 type:complete len:491 (-) Transcript_81415:102-1574(-)